MHSRCLTRSYIVPKINYYKKLSQKINPMYFDNLKNPRFSAIKITINPIFRIHLIFFYFGVDILVDFSKKKTFFHYIQFLFYFVSEVIDHNLTNSLLCDEFYTFFLILRYVKIRNEYDLGLLDKSYLIRIFYWRMNKYHVIYAYVIDHIRFS